MLHNAHSCGYSSAAKTHSGRPEKVIIYNPWRMCEGYGSRSVCVYLSVTTLATTYHVYTLKVRCRRVLCGIFKVFVVWVSLKMLRSEVMASFADHCCLPCSVMSSQWTKETEMASFQLKECVQLAKWLHSF